MSGRVILGVAEIWFRATTLALLAVLLVLIVDRSKAEAQAPPILSEKNSNLDLGSRADHYLDRSGEDTIETFARVGGAEKFRKSTGSPPNYGVRPTRTAVLWLRVQVPDVSAFGRSDWVLSMNEPRTRRLTLYLPDSKEYRSIVWTAGIYDHDPVSVARYPTIHLRSEDISGRLIYVKVETASSMRGFLWLSTERHFDWSYSRAGYLLGTMSGGLLAIVVFVLANGLIARDRASLALAGTMLSYFLYFVAHHAVLDTYLVPGAIEISRPMSLSATFGIFSFALLFAYFALEIGKNYPRLRWSFILCIVALFLLSLLTIADVLLNWFVVRAYSAHIGATSRFLTLLAAALTLVYNWRRAVMFIVCWLPSIIGANLRLVHDVWPALGASEIGLNSAYVLSMLSLMLFAIFSSIDIHLRERQLTAAVATQAERIRGFAEQEKLAAIGQMAGKIAHEINNLLHPIINLAHRAANESTQEADRAQSLKGIHEAAKRASAVVASLLTSVTPEFGESRRLPLGTAVAEATNTIAVLIPATVRIDIEISDRGGPEVLYGDAFRVLINLIANGVHALESDGAIRVAFGREGAAFMLKVSDSGRGMDTSTVQKALQPFFTTRRGAGGTGLGLSLVDDIVNKWKGLMAISSSEGNGTTISIRLDAQHSVKELT